MTTDAWQAYEACKRVITGLGLPAHVYEQRLRMVVCALGEALGAGPIEGCCCYEHVGDNDLCRVHKSFRE